MIVNEILSIEALNGFRRRPHLVRHFHRFAEVVEVVQVLLCVVDIFKAFQRENRIVQVD